MTSLLKHKALWTLTGIAAFIFAIVSFLPEPIDINLHNIGNGKPSVVFVYDPNLIVSNEQAREFNKAQETTAINANFLIARTGYPETVTFMQRYNVDTAQVAFIDGNGLLKEKRFAPVSAEALIQWVETN